MTTHDTPGPTIYWHHLFGELLKLLLIPVGVDVSVDVKVMDNPPEADVILLRREGDTWTNEQLQYLPDGIRDVSAQHVLIEFKYSELLNKKVLRQTGTYEQCYRASKKLKLDELAIFVVMSTTPRKTTLEKYGYYQTEKVGIYQTDNPLADDLTLILLNKLPPEEYNAFVKLFASRKKEQKVALSMLNKGVIKKVSFRIASFVQGIAKVLSLKEDIKMEQLEITPEDVIDLGERLMRCYVENLPIEERLAGLQPEERLAGLQPEERLAGLQPEERLAGLQPEEVLRLYEPEEMLRLYEPEEILLTYRPEERLVGLTREEIEAYLQKLDSNTDMPET